MRSLRYLALLAILAIPAAFITAPAQAQVSVGIGIGGPIYGGPGYAYGPPVCRYGYYDAAPYACAPYGYYGPQWFNSGIFIGTGPWGRGYGGYVRPYGYGYGYRSGYYGYAGRPGYYGGGHPSYGGGGRGYGNGGGRGFHGGRR